jgi:uncharacterized membrane protein
MRIANLIIILTFSVLVCAPLFSSGFFTSHDGSSHLIKSFYFSKIIFSGHWPGWVDELNYSLGYPTFYFTYPFPYLLNCFWRLFTVSTVDSLKITLFISTFISGLFFFLWGTKIASQKIALVATIIYLFTPYRFLNLYVRMAFGEIIFLGLLPLTLYLLEKGRFKQLSISFAALLLAHLQLSEIFLPFLIGYVLVRRLNSYFVIKSWFVGMGLSAFFWLPAVVLLPLTKFSTVAQFVASHLVTVRQLLYSGWDFGFSGSGISDGMSFQIGIVNWLIVCLSTILAFKAKPLAKYFIVIFWLAVILMTYSPFGFWNLAITQSIQFPWRLLGLAALITPGLLLFLPKNHKLFLIGLVIIVLYTNRNHIRINTAEFIHVSDDYFFQTNTTATATPDEFMPVIQDKSVFINHPIIPVSGVISLFSLAVLVLFKKTYEQIQT